MAKVIITVSDPDPKDKGKWFDLSMEFDPPSQNPFNNKVNFKNLTDAQKIAVFMINEVQELMEKNGARGEVTGVKGTKFND